MYREPALTFPGEVAEFVREQYSGAATVLEYGTGGSTVIAARTPGLRCFAVESDRAWAANLSGWIEANAPDGRVSVHYADIGPTGEWGGPARNRRMHLPRYLQYSRSVWRRRDFRHPDVVLVDGRFRVGCFLTTLFRIRRPVRLLFDDYADRAQYHVVERYGAPARMIGRMAVFDLEPDRITWPALLSRTRLIASSA